MRPADKNLMNSESPAGQVFPGLAELHALCDAQEAERKGPDFRVSNQGSIAILWMLTPAARDWVNENVEYEGWQMWGQNGLAIEPRYVQQLIDGAMEADLLVEA